LGIQKNADRFEDVVFLVAKHAVASGYLGVAALGLVIIYIEMFGQSLDISARDIDSIITATVSRTLEAIEEDTKRAAARFLPSVVYCTH
jgi:hypothetical protein